jgi:GH35 family endo-1,4-beta-xylanase
MKHMKCYNKIVIAALALFSFASCADFTQLDFATPDKPLSIAQLDSLNLGSYKTLKSYVDTVNFMLGAGISATDLAAKGPTFRTIVYNFNEITPINEFKHELVVQSDGTYKFSDVDPFLLNAKAAGLAVYGHALVWNLQQNATYLNSTIAPYQTGTAAPQWVTWFSQDFEPSTATVGAFTVAGGVTGYTADGQGKGGVGRAFTITNSAVRTNDWDVQLFFTFTKAVKTGDKVRLTMDIKSDANASYPTQAHTAPGAYKASDFFGAPSSTPTWSTYVKEFIVTSSQDGCNTIAFNLGKTATTFYFDNAKVEFYDTTYGLTTNYRGDAEKSTIIDSKLDAWISAIVKESKSVVKAWDVVNEPLADNITDPAQYKLKTGIGRTLAANEFYWQDYLGKDYAVKAITYARKYGNATDKLFVSDYGMEAVDQIKCQSMVNYVAYIESKGVKVDGIGAELHVVLGKTSLDGIKAMFTNLAKTGKLIKVTQLDMGISTGAANLQTAAVTFAQLKQMSDFYKDIVKAYIANIPAAQRYGITTWSVIDSPTGAAVKVGEPVGLWFTNNSRKPAYAGFANGLQGK